MEQPTVLTLETSSEAWPDHTQLPEKDGEFVHNFQELPQTRLLTESLEPHLDRLHPDKQYCIGADSGIYWRVTTPPLDGCKAPDWFYVPGVPPLLNGAIRRSYVLWQEGVRPLLVVEYVSGDGSEERDTTPHKGKFWVYEQAIGAAFYAIFEVNKCSVEVYKLDGGRYRPVPPNEAGRFPIDPLGIELGIWEGTFQNYFAPWVRAWDAHTKQLLPAASLAAKEARARAETAEQLVDDTRKMLQEEVERAESERRRAIDAEKAANEQRLRAEDERRRAENAEKTAKEEREQNAREKERAEKLAERLRALGVDPDS